MTIPVMNKVKPKKKPKKKTLDTKAIALWSKIIRINGYCEWCGKSTGNLYGHHTMGKKGLLRFELRNGIALCFTCHFLKAHSDSAKEVEEYLKWVKVYKADDWEYLLQLRNELTTTSVEWYQDNIKRLQGILKEME